ncbi:MAG: hypothetical protein CM15mV20_0930 [uncultured marine virus]|nr:MAG: hypothetical protein CM15mV20_0930 [uncultured marine virus]
MKRFRDIRESYLRIQERGRTYNIVFNWRGKMYDINMFFLSLLDLAKQKLLLR